MAIPWGEIRKAVGSFFKRTLLFWILVALFAIATLVDYVYYTTFDLTLSAVLNTDGKSDSLYYSTVDRDELVYFHVLLTRNGDPVEGHSLVAIGQAGGQIRVPRVKTDEEGIAVFEFAPNPQYREPKTAEGKLYVYDEDNAIIIEFRLERVFPIQMVKREEL